jgi:hypothetical protein
MFAELKNEQQRIDSALLEVSQEKTEEFINILEAFRDSDEQFKTTLGRVEGLS